MTPSAAVAAHRFGLGEASLAAVGADASGWLLGQIGPADVQIGIDLPDTAAALASSIALTRRQREARRMVAGPATPSMSAPPDAIDSEFRSRVQADQRARLATAATTMRPFAERLALFWANHFTTSVAKANVRGLAVPFERDGIRPQIAGRFEHLQVPRTALDASVPPGVSPPLRDLIRS